MSGICGICEPGRTLNPASIKAMLAAFVLPEESSQQSAAADSVALGVSRRWDFQQVAAIPGVQKVEISFRESKKILLHDRGGAAPLKLERPPRPDEAAPVVGTSDSPRGRR